MIVADADTVLEITGQGDVLEPHDGILGASYAHLSMLLPTDVSFSSHRFWEQLCRRRCACSYRPP